MSDSELKVLEQIHNSFGRKDRYTYSKIELNGQVRFLKTGTADDSSDNLHRELVWVDFMEHVCNQFPELRVRAPGYTELISDNQLAMEYIELPLLANPRNGQAWVQHIDRFADMLVTLDQAAASYRLPAQLGVFKRRNFDETLKWWLRDLELTDDMKSALSYVKGRRDTLKKRMQHGDLTAWQIFDNGPEWIIYDGERSGDDLPRFNDLAYAAGRLAIRCGQPEAADYMIQRFLERSGMKAKEFYHHFRPVFLLRLLGMVGDGMRDPNSKELDAAQKLLHRTLQETEPNRYRLDGNEL